MPVKSDGTRPSGSRVLTLNSVTYIADDFSVDYPTQFLDGRDQYNEPDGGVTLADFITGSANLQLASSSTAIPVMGQEFTETVLGSSTAFYVTHVSQPENKGSLKRVSIQFRKKYH